MRTQAEGEKAAELQVLEGALHAFGEMTGVAATIVEIGMRPDQADAVVRLDNETLRVEIKKQITPATLGAVLAQIDRLKGLGLVATGYVTPPMAERLRQLNIQFIDMAGNAYLHTADKFFFITGRKPAAAAPGERARRLFRATGLRVIFALLCVPELAGAPYREIAAKAGVALGSVNIILKELEQLGFMHTGKAQGRVLVQRERLLNAWVEAYAHELRPRLKPRRFRVERLDWWKEEDLDRLDLWLGGEPAAALLTKYLRPGVVTLYGGAGFKELAARIRPVKDDHGNLELLEPFWHFDVTQPLPGYRLTPPLLIYADLLASADARNLETAAMIKERYLV